MNPAQVPGGESGRALLAKQLVRRGLALSTGSLTAGFFGEAAPACVPASLASSTLKAAMFLAAGQAATAGAISAPVAALAEGVLKSMLLSKFKMGSAVLVLTVLLGAGGTAGVLAYRAGGEKPETEPLPAASKKEQEKPQTPPRTKQAQPASEKAPPASTAADKDDRIRSGDLLTIRTTDSLPNSPIRGVYQVEASGKVALGPLYGRVDIKGLTLEEAETKIQKHLARLIKDPAIQVTRPIPKNPALERRVQQLESEVRALRDLVEELRKKTRD